MPAGGTGAIGRVEQVVYPTAGRLIACVGKCVRIKARGCACGSIWGYLPSRTAPRCAGLPSVARGVLSCLPGRARARLGSRVCCARAWCRVLTGRQSVPIAPSRGRPRSPLSSAGKPNRGLSQLWFFTRNPIQSGFFIFGIVASSFNFSRFCSKLWIFKMTNFSSRLRWVGIDGSVFLNKSSFITRDFFLILAFVSLFIHTKRLDSTLEFCSVIVLLTPNRLDNFSRLCAAKLLKSACNLLSKLVTRVRSNSLRLYWMFRESFNLSVWRSNRNFSFTRVLKSVLFEKFTSSLSEIQ